MSTCFLPIASGFHFVVWHMYLIHNPKNILHVQYRQTEQNFGTLCPLLIHMITTLYLKLGIFEE